MNFGLKPIKTDADVERVCAAALLHEQIHDPMDTIPSEDELANYSKGAGVMVMIARNYIKGFIAKEDHRIYAKCAHLDVRNLIEETLGEML